MEKLFTEWPVTTMALDGEDACASGVLWSLARGRGLSLGDRCCLALAKPYGVPCITADGGWAGLESATGVELLFIR